MIEARSYTMVIGCGEKGVAWVAKNQNHKETVIGFDTKQIGKTHEPFIIGNVFNLPIKSGTINKIHGDFIVNGLIDREIAASQIFRNPDVLDTNYFPPLVREWFVKSMNGSYNLVRNNIKEVSALLRTVALREMWRILANNGSLELLDFEYNVEWIKHSAPQIVQENPLFLKLKSEPITREDFERSASLEKVGKGSTRIQKIKLIKFHHLI